MTVEAFEVIKQFAQDTEGNLYVDNNTDTLIISNDKTKNSVNDGPYKTIKPDDLPVKAEVLKIIKDMNYVGVYEKGGPGMDGVIIFMRTAGQEESGIVYVEDDTPGYGQEMEKITDCRYYYWIGHV